MAKVIGIRPGSSAIFIASLVPSASALQSGPSYSTDDAKVTITLTNDPYVVFVAVASDNSAASFNLTLSGQTSSGRISSVFAIPILPD